MIKTVVNDGGRKASGLPFTVKTCLPRCLSIVSGIDYLDCVDLLGNASSERPERFREVMRMLGWGYKPLRIRFRGFVEPGRLIVAFPSHHVAVVDGAVHDVVVKNRDGDEMVGYWKEQKRVAS